MFWGLFKKKSTPFSEREKMIFRFWDGEKDRAIDPLVVRRKMHAQNKEWLKLAIMINPANIDKLPNTSPELKGLAKERCDASLAEIAKYTRTAFDIPEVKISDNKTVGLTDWGCAEVLATWLEFMEACREDASFFPVSQPSTESADCDSITKPIAE